MQNLSSNEQIYEIFFSAAFYLHKVYTQPNLAKRYKHDKNISSIRDLLALGYLSLD